MLTRQQVVEARDAASDVLVEIGRAGGWMLLARRGEFGPFHNSMAEVIDECKRSLGQAVDRLSDAVDDDVMTEFELSRLDHANLPPVGGSAACILGLIERMGALACVALFQAGQCEFEGGDVDALLDDALEGGPLGVDRDERMGLIEGVRAEAAAVIHRIERPGHDPAPAASEAPVANWSPVLSKAEIARRVKQDANARARDLLPLHLELKGVGRKFIVRLDTIDAEMRRRILQPLRIKNR